MFQIKLLLKNERSSQWSDFLALQLMPFLSSFDQLSNSDSQLDQCFMMLNNSRLFTIKQSIQKVRRWIPVLIFIKETIRSVLPSRSSLFNNQVYCLCTIISSCWFYRLLGHNKLVTIAGSFRETCPNWKKPWERSFVICKQKSSQKMS